MSRMNSIFFVAANVETSLDLEKAGLDALADAADSLDFAPALVVSQKLKRKATPGGIPVWGILDNSAAAVKFGSLINARLLGMHRFDALADRLAYLADARGATPDSTICILDAAIPELESVWQFMLTVAPEKLPHIHVHLTRFLDPSLVLEAEHLSDLDDRIRLLRSRFDARGVLQSGRLTLSAEHPALAERFSGLGLETQVAQFSPAPRQTTTNPALLVKSLDQSVLVERDLKHAKVFVTDALVETTRNALADSGADIERLISVTRLSEAAGQLRRYRNILTEPDLLDLVVSCGWPAGCDRLELLGQTQEPRRNGQAVAKDAAGFVKMVHDLAGKAGTPKPKPVVLHIANNWWGQGSSHVFEAQLRYLSERGYAVHAVHFDIDAAGFSKTPEELAAYLAKLPQDGAIHRWYLGREPQISRKEHELGLYPPYTVDMLSVEGESRVSRNVAVPPHLRQALDALQPSWVLCNYSQNHPLLSALGLQSVPSIAETHDLRVYQHAVYGRAETVDSFDYEIELDNAGRFDGVVFINRHEEQVTRERFPDLKSVTAFPFMMGNASIEPKALHESAATGMLRALGRSRRACLPLLSQLLGHHETGDTGRKLALFVGSSHKANVVSLNWYLANVHLPFRLFEHVEVIVAGNIADEFANTDIPGVTFLGRVDDLLELYDIADIVLLPIRVGTGLPIKVIDTMLAGKPFVCTSKAISAIGEMEGAWPVFDDPAGYAEEVRRLTCDAEYLAAATRKLAKLCDPEESWVNYTRQWDSLVEQVTGTSPPPAGPPLAVAKEPRRMPLPRQILLPGQSEQMLPDGLLWQLEGLNFDQETGVFHFTQPYARMALAFAVADNKPGRIEISGMLNSDQRPDTLVHFYVNGTPVGSLSTNATYQQPFHLVADYNLIDGSAMAIVEILISNQAGIPIFASDGRWVAIDNPRVSLWGG